MVVDVERFGDPARTNLNQLAVRDGLYKALIQAFGRSGIEWGSCVSEDRGDGALILVPPEVPKAYLVTSLPGMLAAAVSRHNAGCAGPEPMRLRVALHAGEVYRDAHGVAGSAVNHAFRLAEAPALRSALAASPGVLAVIVSDWLFSEVVRHDPAAEPGSYRKVQVAVKETAAVGWVRVSDPGMIHGDAGQGDIRLRRDGTATGLENLQVAVGPVVRSAYLEQVKRIAPPQLHDRDDELAELAAFCTEPGLGPYVWWRAPPWAGKSALMSWFVLNAPPSVEVVSFFVTARWKGQDDREAFINAVLEQLADLLGQPIPAYLTETTREPHLLRMLAQAAEECQQRDKRLVLVVDGLDEDRGVTTGSDAHSIAELLPARPPAGLRVIVAGRHDPPIPPDVPDDHPLRDPGIARVLSGSRWAAVVRADMQRELKRLRHGSQDEQDLLGMVTAAGGGLSADDLAELTGVNVRDIQESLHAVAGRTFTSRVSQWQSRPGSPVYVLGHEELQTAATESLGPERLKKYRQHLYAWGEDYRQRGWPASTPEYLLRGYFRLLQETADIPRLLTCATDQARHDRMLDITGGDTAALSEITDLQDLLLHQEEPDLPALARLNVHRNMIVERNAHVPVTLPVVWATIGQPERAEALARAITDPGRRAHVLADLARAAATTGDPEPGTDPGRPGPGNR